MACKLVSFSWLIVFSLSCALLVFSSSASDQNDRKSYIVYMGDLPKGKFPMPALHHLKMLQQVIDRNFSPDSLVRVFRRTFNGFVAKLTQDEAGKLSALTGVVSVFPNEKKKLHTTRSWDFMGFSQHVKRTTFESDIVVGMLDTGIWPESESFNDEGFSPPPSRWKGTCQVSSNFSCNNKIIGAKYYRSDGQFGPDDIVSPRDSEGHGTHTASTVAGNLASMANLYGLGLGTARGGVPAARIAVYKICWSDGCYDADILAAFDDAIADGVDLISLSVGGSTPLDYFNDPIAIGAFHAMKNGILTSNSAGNDGPGIATITNFSPWSLSVAASTIDRKFFTKVQLGNNKSYEGISINTFNLNNSMYPVIYAGAAPNTSANITGSFSRFCFRNSLDANSVKGKIVVCDALITGQVPLEIGAAGILMQNQGSKDVARIFPLPASHLNTVQGDNILSYINSTSNPMATIYKSSEGNDALAPSVASFSSRGPNPVTLDLLKPDITAPGVDILAAWSMLSTVSGRQGDNRFAPYNIISGTSMSCPHATAAAAYIKSYHPSWSPAALKSSLMTTAFPMSPESNPDAEFAYGAGHINPVKAINPGLIYDAEPVDYIKFLCGQGYNTSVLQLVTGDNSICSAETNATVWDLNYPSFAVSTIRARMSSRIFNRIVTNVGSPTSSYNATVTAPPGINIQVNPSILTFSSLGQKLSFSLTVEGTLNSETVSASLVWDDGVYQVRSPITLYVVTF